MQDKAPVRMDRLDLEEREEQLREFVRSALTGASATSGSLLLLAKSPESMVARVVFSLSSELAAAGIAAEVVYAAGATVAPGDSWSMSFDPAFTHETRMLRDPRYLDGHEQLICGGAHTWYGDCMRREADKRDAFSAFFRGNTDVTSRGRRTFQAIWGLAERIYTHVAMPAVMQPPETTESASGPVIPAASETLEVWRPALQH